MRIGDLPSWHRFTYTQLYPAVLGAMLYDVLHVTEHWGALQVVGLSIVGLTVVGLLILVYNLTPDRRSLGVVLPHAVLAGLFAILAWLTTRLDGVTWTFVTASWLPTVWYAAYVFGLANRTFRAGRPRRQGRDQRCRGRQRFGGGEGGISSSLTVVDHSATRALRPSMVMAPYL